MQNFKASDKQELFDFLISEVNQPFSGWDFSYISRSRRMMEFPLRWSYASKVLPYLRKADSLLDMGTGGGEFLSRFRPLPKNTCATEAYSPNVPIARQRLEPLGVKVYEIDEDDERLPFDDDQFDLIINRHEAFSCKEIQRILKSGHHFITQQYLDARNDEDIRHALGYHGPIDDPWNVNEAANELTDLNFEILEKREEVINTRFYDVGAIAFYLNAIPWVVPGFTIEKYLDPLFKLHQYIQEHDYIDFASEAAFLIARKL